MGSDGFAFAAAACPAAAEAFAKYCGIVSGCTNAKTRQGLIELSQAIDGIEGMRDAIFADIPKLMPFIDLEDVSLFNYFYDFVFFICRENGQKSITIQRAVAAWRIVLNGRFRLLDRWCNFVDYQRHNISEDTWQQLLAFSRCVNEDLEGYYPRGAWPVLIDDFVEHMHRRDSMATTAALAVTDEVALPIRAVGDLAAAADVPREEVAVITQCEALGGKLPFDDASVGAVLAVIKNVESLRDQLVSEISRVLKAGGRVLVQNSAPSSSLKPNTNIERKLLMGGFVEVQASAASTQDAVLSVTIKAKKASWSMGSSFPLKKATKVLPKIQIDDDSELIDEDSLLTEEDLKKPQLPVVGDCEVGATRKACKNCVCGRAEAEQKGKKLELTAEQINNPQSACGSCGLGDAFRCGTCPYRGLPPFKPGEKVSLASNFLAADI